MSQKCCNQDCNQGRDCPLRKKELTDEEITDIASELLIATDAIEYEWGVCVTEFARAILRKAQEK